MYQKGGVCIFIRNDVCFSQVDLLNYCVEKILEICAVKLEFNGRRLIIARLYRSPAGDFYEFLHFLEQAFLFLCRSSTEFLLCGDFNMDYLLNSNQKHEQSVLLRTFNVIHTLISPLDCNTIMPQLLITFLLIHEDYVLHDISFI
jgi:hypothetical protein